MSKSTCTFPGCERPYKCKGLCNSHYEQKRNGIELRPIGQRSHGDYRARFWSKVEKTDGCWNWVGTNGPKGYGTFKCEGRFHRPHRLALTISGVDIPEGMQVDHACRNRKCVNPAHLRIVTNKQNRENLSGARSDNRTGVRGVTWHERDKKYIAKVTHNYKQIHIGSYATIEDAEAAVIAKRLELFTHNDADRVTN